MATHARTERDAARIRDPIPIVIEYPFNRASRISPSVYEIDGRAAGGTATFRRLNSNPEGKLRNLRVNRKPDDMPLYGLINKVSKGVYEVTIKAKASKRVIDIDLISLPSVSAVKQFFARMYPTLTWGEPKYAKPKLVIPKRAKVTRKVKPKKRKGKRHAIPRAVRLRHKHGEPVSPALHDGPRKRKRARVGSARARKHPSPVSEGNS